MWRSIQLIIELQGMAAVLLVPRFVGFGSRDAMNTGQAEANSEDQYAIERYFRGLRWKRSNLCFWPRDQCSTMVICA